MDSKHYKLILILLLFLNLICEITFLPSKCLAKNDVIYASYKYVLGDNDTKNDARRICFIEAKRRCLEKAGTYVEGITEIRNFQLTQDEIKTYTAALIKVDIVREKVAMEGDSIAIDMTVKAEVNTDELERKIRQIGTDKTLQKQIKEQQRKLSILEAKLTDLQKELASSGYAKAMTLRKKREEYFNNIWDNLLKSGLMPPGDYDIESAKKLIVMTIQATAYRKGDWWLAHGLLGSTRIPKEPEELLYASVGYTSLFQSAVAVNWANTKMETVAQFDNFGLFLHSDPKCRSWVFRRERYLGLIGYELNDRFTYDKKGNYGRILSPTPDHPSNMRLKWMINEAYELYSQLKKRDFEDKTLGDAIGVATAFLKYDGRDPKNLYLLPFADQIYSDTVAGIIERMKEGAPFYSALSINMIIRGLRHDDIIALPDNEEQVNTLVTLIGKDFTVLEKLMKSPKEK